jgi:outer membrane protein TolC
MQFNRSGVISVSGLFLAGLLFVNASFAEAASHVRPHGLEQLVEAAIDESQLMEASRGRSAVLRERSEHLSHWDDPEMRLGYGRDVNVDSELKSSRYPRHEYDASLRVFPRNPWEVRARKGKIEAEQDEVQLRMQVQTQQLCREVEELYWDASYTKAEREVQAALVEIKQAQAKGVQTLLKNGQVTLDESLPIQMEQLDSAMERDALEQELQNLLGQLSRLTGVAAGQIRLDPTHAIPTNAFDLPYDAWKQRAVENRLELAIFNAKIDYSKAALKEVRASDIPWIKHIEGGYQVVNDYGDRDSYGVQIAFSIPWFTDRDGGLASVKAELNSQHRQRMLSRKQIEAEVNSLVERFRFQQAQWQRYQSEIRPMADVLRETVKNLEAGQRLSNPSYWNAKSALLELEFKELRLSKRYLKLLLQAEAVLGERVEV